MPKDVERDIEDLKPCVPFYGPCNVKDLVVGNVMFWCRCGLSQTQPWCDGSHKGTGFKPLRWIVPGTLKDGKNQSIYSICNCKYTKSPPFCDATHINLPLLHLKAQNQCHKDHNLITILCTSCGYKPNT